MRKLTLLATTAIALVALMAAAAAPASADRPFALEDQHGNPCDPCHEELDGSVDLETTIGEYSTCEVRFDAYIYGDGSFETADMDVENCTNPWSGFVGTQACDDAWHGQGRLPDQGPFQLDITTCLQSTNEPEQRHDITYKVIPGAGGTRLWDQLGTATMHSPSLFQVEDSLYTDVNPDENLVLVLL